MIRIGTRTVFGVGILIFLVSSTAALAQPGPGPGPRMGDGQGKGEPAYDPATEVTIEASVAEVLHPESPKGWHGVHLVLETEEELPEVHLGPAFYVEEEQGFTLAEGDTVKVVASRTEYRGEDALIAREITKDGETLVLRDEDGRPKWSRRARMRNR